MSAAQIFSSVHGVVNVEGRFMLIFFAFNLLPYIFSAVVLEKLFPEFQWKKNG